jgi:hypothetical protein
MNAGYGKSPLNEIQPMFIQIRPSEKGPRAARDYASHDARICKKRDTKMTPWRQTANFALDRPNPRHRDQASIRRMAAFCGGFDGWREYDGGDWTGWLIGAGSRASTRQDSSSSAPFAPESQSFPPSSSCEFLPNRIIFGGRAPTHNQLVGGSSPPSPTTQFQDWAVFLRTCEMRPIGRDSRERLVSATADLW